MPKTSAAQFAVAAYDGKVIPFPLLPPEGKEKAAQRDLEHLFDVWKSLPVEAQKLALTEVLRLASVAKRKGPPVCLLDPVTE